MRARVCVRARVCLWTISL